MMGGSGIGAEGRKQRRAGGVQVPSVPDSRDAADKVQGLDGPSHDDKGKGGVPDVWTFDLDYTCSRGHKWQGAFTTHILSITERAQVGLTKARLAGGVSVNMLDPETSLILEMQAHLAIALRKWPTWADDLDTIRDVNVLGAIYQEVVDHEERFWRAGPASTSDSPSEES